MLILKLSKMYRPAQNMLKNVNIHYSEKVKSIVRVLIRHIIDLYPEAYMQLRNAWMDSKKSILECDR